MSSALVIGSTVCDVMVYLDRLPSREGDAHIDHQQCCQYLAFFVPRL